MKEPIFIGIFDNVGDIIREFEAPADALDNCEVLFAAYTYENYSGDAFVLYKKDGKFYEVHGSHCSCNGLDGQWEPEETSVAALGLRPYTEWAGLKELVTELQNET